MDLNLEFLEFQSFITIKKLRHEMQRVNRMHITESICRVNEEKGNLRLDYRFQSWIDLRAYATATRLTRDHIEWLTKPY